MSSTDKLPYQHHKIYREGQPEKLGGEAGIDPTYTAGSRFLLKLKIED